MASTVDGWDTSRSRGEQGFSLIELLIVVIILGILAGIAVVSVGSTRSTSVATVCKTDVRMVQAAAEAVAAKSDYPSGDISSATPVPSNLLLAATNAANGAILTTWPDNDDYEVMWHGAARQVEVLKKNPAVDAATPPPPPVPAGPGFSGCENLDSL